MTATPAPQLNQQQRKGPMDRMIAALASGFGDGIGWLADHGILFGAFLVLWIVVGAGIVWSQGSVDQAWQAIRALPLLLQLVVWLLFLPVMAGVWIWETTWPLLVRIVLVAGLAGWNLLVFLPKAAAAGQP